MTGCSHPETLSTRPTVGEYLSRATGKAPVSRECGRSQSVAVRLAAVYASLTQSIIRYRIDSFFRPSRMG